MYSTRPPDPLVYKASSSDSDVNYSGNRAPEICPRSFRGPVQFPVASFLFLAYVLRRVLQRLGLECAGLAPKLSALLIVEAIEDRSPDPPARKVSVW